MKKSLLTFIIVFLILVIVAESTLFIFYRSKIKTNRNIIFKHEYYVVNMLNQAINKELNVIIDDVVLLAEHTQVLNVWNSSNTNFEVFLNQLQREYQVFSKGRGKLYDQLRFIDENGDEKVRINLVNGLPVIVEKNDLQNKRYRYYFKDIIKLNDEQIYISPLDLNIEKGEIELPYKPMIRVGKPIYNAQKQKKGIVIINFLAQSIIDVFENNNLNSYGQNYFLNSDGYYFRSDNKNEEWAFMFPEKDSISFAHFYSSEWKEINSSVNGQFRNEAGLYTFTTIFPLTAGTISSSGSAGAFTPSEEMVKPDKYYWKVISFVSKDELQALNWPIWIEFFEFSFFLCLGILLLSIIITDLRNKSKKAESALRLTNQNLERIVDERTRELVYAKEKAEESDRLKSAFLANMSHEIRTPMNGIMGFLNLLNRPNLSGKQQKEYIQIIEKSSNRMLDTINDIINISKIESGYESLIIKEVNVSEIMENLFSFFYPEVKQKGLLFNFFNELTEDNSTIKTDEDKLNSILTNLIKNAIKFTKEGFIEFSCHKKIKESGIYLEFCVTDTGIGIPNSRNEAVFDRFVQADIDDIDVYEGSGLGLSISKAYVELLEGKIWLESKVGLGSKFFFTIPYCPVETKQISQTKDLKDAELKCLKFLKVLITEDDKTSELLLKKYLKPFCKELHIAHSGYEAIEICQQNADLDLVLMDIKMPGMNGFEAIRRIRSFNKDAIIIAQSALTVSQLESEYGQVGCNDFVTKPINEGELYCKINHYFSETTQ